jgi:hypothetical protein
MKTNITPFFATETDLAQVIDQIVVLRPLQFVVGGMFDLASVHSSHTWSKPFPANNYLVADRELVVVVREVRQRDGGKRFAIDQCLNPETVALRPGGLIDSTYLLAGQLGTVNENQVSLAIYKMFLAEICKRFSKIKSYYVGKEAADFLDKGLRLTANPKSPRLFDLSRTEA